MNRGTHVESARPKSVQWRLATLLIVMFGFALCFAGIANMRCVVDMQVNFQSLPPTDQKLEAWLKRSYGVSKLSIQRGNEQTIALRFSRAFYAVDIPKPPWREMGYGPMRSFVFTQGLSTGWWIPIGLLIVLFSGRISRTVGSLMSWFSSPRDSSAASLTTNDG